MHRMAYLAFLSPKLFNLCVQNKQETPLKCCFHLGNCTFYKYFLPLPCACNMRGSVTLEPHENNFTLLHAAKKSHYSDSLPEYLLKGSWINVWLVWKAAWLLFGRDSGRDYSEAVDKNLLHSGIYSRSPGTWSELKQHTPSSFSETLNTWGSWELYSGGREEEAAATTGHEQMFFSYWASV